MFCKNCNNQIPDGSQFCSVCGAKQDESTPVTEEIGATTVLNEEMGVAENSNEVTNEQPFENESDKSKFNFKDLLFTVKESFLKHTKIWIGAVAVLLALVIVFNLAAISGFCVKLFGSDAKYAQYVEKKAAEETIDATSAFYGALRDIADTNYKAEVEVGLNISKNAIKDFEDMTDIELDWLKKLSVFASANVKKDAASAEFGVKLGSSDVISAETILDIAGKKLFVGLTNLSKNYLSTDIAIPEGFSLDMIADFAKELPSEAKFKKMLDKYVDIAIEQIDDVSEDKDTIKAGDIEQKVTASKMKIKEKTSLDIIIAVLEEARNDKDIKALIQDFVKTAKKQPALSGQTKELNADEVYENFVLRIDTALENFKSQKDALTENETLYVIITYIDSEHKVVGREVKMPQGDSNVTVSSYVTPHKGDKFALKYEADGMKITGEGKDKDGVITGEFNFFGNSQGLNFSYFSVELEKFDTNAFAKGELKGTVIITPNNALGAFAGISGMSALSLISDGIELVFDAGLEKGKIEFNILKDDDLYAGIEMKYDSGKGSGVKIPSDKKTFSAEEVEYFLDTLNFDKITKALKKAKVDSDIIETVENLLNGIKEGNLSSFGSFSSTPDYYSDYSDYEWDY